MAAEGGEGEEESEGDDDFDDSPSPARPNPMTRPRQESGAADDSKGSLQRRTSLHKTADGGMARYRSERL